MKWNFLSKSKNIFILTLVLSLVPLLTIISKIWLGEFAFWYDPARDLLSAVDNLSKPTLIGPTSGIPGVFYGPYWIWLLSVGTLFSLDPRIVTLIVVTLPYVILFPFVLSRFYSVVSPFVLALLWLLFVLGFNNYFTDLWNPHLAPLFIFIVIFLLFSLTHTLSFKNLLLSFSAGFTMGLVMNFHLSLGIGMLLGVIVYLIGAGSNCLIRTKKKVQLLFPLVTLGGVFFLGCIAAFAPFILFEIRHQFLQTQTLVTALFHYGGVVSLQGLSQSEIIHNFFGTMAKLLYVPVIFAEILLFAGVIFYGVSLKKRKVHLKEKEIRLVAILGCIVFGILFIYLTAKNPIWEYHFIGVEVLFLLLIGILVNTSSLMKKILAGWVIILLAFSLYAFVIKIGKDRPLIFGTLIAKENAVEKVVKEAGNTDYTVFAYNPSIYTYDYAYLFKWKTGKDFSYRPELIRTGADIVFIIIPDKTEKSKRTDFINFRTPQTEYETLDQWLLQDGTEIIKRGKM